jgi:membrane protein
MKTIRLLLRCLRDGYSNFRSNDPLILASSTAFFATFSLSPILVILVNVLMLTFDNDRIPAQLFGKLSNTFGKESAAQIQNIVENVSVYQSDPFITVGGFIFLLFVATTLLKVVKQSINHLWHVKRKDVSRIRYNLQERLTAASLILFVALLFLDYVHDLLPDFHVALLKSLNIAFSILVVTAWFAILFKFLPDAHVTWKVTLVGGLVTGILFNTGKWILGKLLLYNNIASIFGASASFALILLFIFYVGLILYFGASFTFAYGEYTSQPIVPGKFSQRYEVTAIEDEPND